MDELRYVIKCFIFAGLLMTLSQVRMGEFTVESRVELYLTESDVAQFMQEAAMGGAKAIEKALVSAKAFVQEKTGNGSLQNLF